MFLRYGVWQMQLFFNLGYLSPFYPPNSWKISKKWKKPRDIIILCKWTKMMLIGYTGPEIWHMTHVIVTFQFGLYENFTKKNENKKPAWRYHHFTQVNQNDVHRLYWSWDMVCDTCNCYFSIWAIWKFHKKWKNLPGDIILHMCT